MARRAYSRKCSNCRQQTVILSAVPYSVKMNHDGREYIVDIPSLNVPKCSACGNFVLDKEANKQIDRAFRNVARLLTPEAIRSGREALRLTQQELADRLGIAVSTLSRWETGAQIQQRAMNDYLQAYFAVPELRYFLNYLRGVKPVGIPCQIIGVANSPYRAIMTSDYSVPHSGITPSWNYGFRAGNLYDASIGHSNPVIQGKPTVVLGLALVNKR
jgi:putative zinc finger/helix-turn-helix YgiT family protein